MKKINKQRKDYLSWDEFFIGVAKLAARRSKDPNTQVGACIVSKNNRILSVGYNGTPNGYDDHYFPWDREGDALETKYLYVVHAERNAILNYRGSNKDLEGIFTKIDEIEEYNSSKVLDAFIRNSISESDFNSTTGYGYNDIGRDKIERV